MNDYNWMEDSEYIIPPENIERLRKAANSLEVGKTEPLNDDYLTIFAFREMLGSAVESNKRLNLTMEFLLKLEEEITKLEEELARMEVVK